MKRENLKMTYKAKEVRKLEELTKKLKSQGDVSPEEADLVYMLRQIYEAYCYVSSKHDSGSERKVLDFSRLNSNYFYDAMEYDFTDSFLNPMQNAFNKWYRTVANLVASGYTGNFVTTIPVFLSVEEKTTDLMRFAFSRLSEEDRIIKITGDQARELSVRTNKLLTSDALFFYPETGHPILTFARCGLVPRLERNASDVLFLQRMAEKLKNEDITPEESDLIYTIFKFSQTLKSRSFRFYGERKDFKRQTDRLKNALNLWFKTVYEVAKSGRTGNFLHTLPVCDFTGYSSIVKKTLNLLPKQFSMAKLSARPDLPDMAGVFFDSERNVLMSQRCGIVQEAAQADRYVLFKDSDGVSYRFENMTKIDPYIFSFRDRKAKINPFVVKFEMLKRNGLLPVCRFRDGITYYVAYERKDKDTVKEIFKIPDEALLSEFPEIPYPYEREIFLKALDKSLYVLKLHLPLIEADPDDSWADVIR